MSLKGIKKGKATRLGQMFIMEICAEGSIIMRALRDQFRRLLQEDTYQKQNKTVKISTTNIYAYFLINIKFLHLIHTCIKFIYTYIKNILDKNISRKQAGLHKRDSTADNIYTITQVTKKRSEYKRPLGLSVDYFKKSMI